MNSCFTKIKFYNTVFCGEQLKSFLIKNILTIYINKMYI